MDIPLSVYAVMIAACPLLMLRLMRVRDVAESSPIELGILFSSVVAVYGLLPLLSLILFPDSFEQVLANRLADLSSVPADAAKVATMHLGLLGGFCFCYGVLRCRDRGFAPGDVIVWDRRLPALLLLFSACLLALPSAIKWALDVPRAEDYIGTYLELVGQPLWLQQIFGVMSAIGTVLVTATIVSILSYSSRLTFLVAAAVTVAVIYSILVGGSRMAAMAALLSFIVTYSLVVRPISVRRAAFSATLLILAFMLGQYVRDVSGDDSISGLEGVLVNNEFTSVFANGLQIVQERDWLAANSMLPNFYVADIARLIPQQLLPFEKVDPSHWYVTTFEPAYAELGGGLAFGAIAESAAGFGFVEAVVRGGLLGALFSWAHAFLSARSRRSLFSLITYVWLVVFSYNSFRDTTFVLVARFVFHVLPALMLVVLARKLIGGAGAKKATDGGVRATATYLPGEQSVARN